MTLVTVRLEGTLEQRDDYWASKVPALGALAYGDTAQEATDRTQKIVEVLLAHWNERGELDRRLRDAGVKTEEEQPGVTVAWSAQHSIEA